MAALARRAWRLCVRVRSIEPIDRRSYYCIPDRVGRASIHDARPFLRSSDAHASSSVGEWSKKCWSCGSPAPSKVFMLCSKCINAQSLRHLRNREELRARHRFAGKAIQRPAEEASPRSIQHEIRGRVFVLQLDLHLVQEEQGFSADQASQVISAYQTLLHPLPRATYLLETLGINVEETGSRNPDGGYGDAGSYQRLLRCKPAPCCAVQGTVENAGLRTLLHTSHEEARCQGCRRGSATRSDSQDDNPEALG